MEQPDIIIHPIEIGPNLPPNSLNSHGSTMQRHFQFGMTQKNPLKAYKTRQFLSDYQNISQF